MEQIKKQGSVSANFKWINCFIIGVFLLLNPGLKAQSLGKLLVFKDLDRRTELFKDLDPSTGFLKTPVDGDGGGLDDQDAEENNDAANDTAPVGSGTVILISFVAVYGICRIYQVSKINK